MRITFDASTKSDGNMSLNDVLYKRPYLLPTLFDLLLKFSVKPTAITVDIERAFSQIVVDENHRGLVTFM